MPVALKAQLVGPGVRIDLPANSTFETLIGPCGASPTSVLIRLPDYLHHSRSGSVKAFLWYLPPTSTEAFQDLTDSVSIATASQPPTDTTFAGKPARWVRDLCGDYNEWHEMYVRGTRTTLILGFLTQSPPTSLDLEGEAEYLNVVAAGLRWDP